MFEWTQWHGDGLNLFLQMLLWWFTKKCLRGFRLKLWLQTAPYSAVASSAIRPGMFERNSCYQHGIFSKKHYFGLSSSMWDEPYPVHMTLGAPPQRACVLYFSWSYRLYKCNMWKDQAQADYGYALKVHLGWTRVFYRFCENTSTDNPSFETI